MADFIKAYYNISVRQAEDISGDEPRLVLAFITKQGNDFIVSAQSTGELASGLDDGPDLINLNLPNRGRGSPGTVSGKIVSDNAPTVEEPFFALIAVAFDGDKSFDSHRERHRARFEASIQEAITEIANQPGGFPANIDTGTLGGTLPAEWQNVVETMRDAANVAMQRHWLIRDRDDAIGLPTCNIFSDLGNEFHSSGFADDNGGFRYKKHFQSIFGSDGSLYNVNWSLTANVNV